MRLIVTGANGQVARALQGLTLPDLEVKCVGRPLLDLATPASVAAALRHAKPDIIVNAAAYTAVDKAEGESEVAFAINEAGARSVAQAAAALCVPLVQLSTDYVFDGGKSAPYVEIDRPSPQSTYGRSKLAGEFAAAAAQPNHVILRASWIYSPYGVNFVRTMLRLAETQDHIAVVGDQRGGPTSALDVAAALAIVARNLVERPTDSTLRGVFHLGPVGEASWAEFAEAIFSEARKRGGPSAKVKQISTRDYPTAAKRPANSRLDASKLAIAHGVRLPPWRQSLSACLDILLRPLELHNP